MGFRWARVRSCWESGQDVVDDVSVDIGQAAVYAVVSNRESSVVDTQLVQDRGVDVMDCGWVVSIKRFISPLIGFAVRCAALEPAAA